jgi:hypothetical protein
MFNSKLQLLTRRQFHELLASRLARPVRISVPSSDPHSAFDSRLRPGPPLTPRHTTSRLQTAGTAFLSTLSQSSERVRGPGHCNSRTDCAPCAVFARSSDGRAAARRTNVVRCASTVEYPVRRVGILVGRCRISFRPRTSREQSSIKVPPPTRRLCL